MAFQGQFEILDTGSSFWKLGTAWALVHQCEIKGKCAFEGMLLHQVWREVRRWSSEALCGNNILQSRGMQGTSQPSLDRGLTGFSRWN